MHINGSFVVYEKRLWLEAKMLLFSARRRFKAWRNMIYQLAHIAAHHRAVTMIQKIIAGRYDHSDDHNKILS